MEKSAGIHDCLWHSDPVRIVVKPNSIDDGEVVPLGVSVSISFESNVGY